ncbi:MAG: hypothetical protein LBP32_08430 [Spirochaetaceae bacterium]|jgi:hypothetical protein|nr:hypothetical protein [Spirochaetaceae bacterium]
MNLFSKNPSGGVPKQPGNLLRGLTIPRGFSVLLFPVLLAFSPAGCNRAPVSLKTNKGGTLTVTLPGYAAAAGPEKSPAGDSGTPAGDAPFPGEIPGPEGVPAGLIELSRGGRVITLDPAYQGRDEVVEIKEKMFITQINDVYLNPEDYMGKILKLEGIFQSTPIDYGEPYYFVLRYGPGCCGYDGNAGFEVIWDKSFSPDTAYPRNNDWVEAVGVLGSYEEDGYPYLCIALSSLTVKRERGAEFVTQ